MNSHKYAQKLRELADFLLSKPEFETAHSPEYSYTAMYYFGEKATFLGAVKALGSGKKEWDDHDLTFKPEGSDMLRLVVSRSAVCRKVQEEKWECEPLLSQEEEASVGA